MTSTKHKLMIVALAATSMVTGASGATWYSQYREHIRLDYKLRHRAALTTHECSMLFDSQRTDYAMHNPMHPEVPCTGGI
ncbi:hypothetical protein [Burkholderia pyrrocinia]|uniref:hypothetical protein n=1 Tax=Burkholderia pyrrocinia TaxID=60550 RepID=UPI0010477B2B|nr:hypothetical protein [Burkholderia pyrrocinia]TDA48094.1 hypothetical protein EVG18_07345 [Burkholderia pyrrocinia]